MSLSNHYLWLLEKVIDKNNFCSKCSIECDDVVNLNCTEVSKVIHKSVHHMCRVFW